MLLLLAFCVFVLFHAMAVYLSYRIGKTIGDEKEKKYRFILSHCRMRVAKERFEYSAPEINPFDMAGQLGLQIDDDGFIRERK